MPTNPMEYIWPGIIAVQAIHAAAKLRIPDLLASGPKTIAELAAGSGAHPPSLERLLRALSTLEMFAPTRDGRFRNTPLTELLCTDHPQSQRNTALFLPAPFLWRPLGELYESVRTGDPVFERIFGQSFFHSLAAHPADAAVFNAVTTQGIAWTSPALLAAYDFSRFERLVDVGGGQGALLRDILIATPGLEGILFDLPQVVSGASEILGGEIASRCQIVGGSFFDSVPEGANAYLLKGVVHDWPDDDAVGAVFEGTNAFQARRGPNRSLHSEEWQSLACDERREWRRGNAPDDWRRLNPRSAGSRNQRAVHAECNG